MDLKVKIVEILNLDHIDPASIGDDDLLFGGNLDLDSIDALELIVLMDRDYGLKIASKEEGLKVFSSIQSIADYIRAAKTT